jgi:hypothetical protein
MALAETAAREQTSARPEPLGAAEWREQLSRDFEPMVSQAVSTLVKLKNLLADKGSTLETIAATTPPDHLSLELWRQRNAIADAAVRLRRELVDKIKEVQLALDRAASFSPEKFSHEAENQAHLIQLALENASGVVIHSRAFRDPRAFKIVTRELPAVPALVTHYAQSMESLLAAYLTVQQKVNAATKTPPKEVVIILNPSPAFERRRREKVGEMVRGRPDPEPPGPLADLGIDTNIPPRI